MPHQPELLQALTPNAANQAVYGMVCESTQNRSKSIDNIAQKVEHPGLQELRNSLVDAFADTLPPSQRRSFELGVEAAVQAVIRCAEIAETSTRQ